MFRNGRVILSELAKLHKYFKRSCTNRQGINYKLPEDDTVVSKHVGV